MTSLRAIIAMLLSAVVLSAVVANHTGARADEALPGRSTTLSASFSSYCLKDTGSRNPRKGRHCSASGHSYTDGDIKRTGASSIGGSGGIRPQHR